MSRNSLFERSVRLETKWLWVRVQLQSINLLIKKHENAGVKQLNDTQAFIEYSNIMDDVYNNIDNIDNYNPKREQKNLDWD